MVDRAYVESQLRKIGFGSSRVNKAEIRELENILLPHEKLYECVNGYYDGGVALLVATDIRVLLIDKKPMGFLNVDDVRFDMVSDIDYSHRVFGAQVSINCGMRRLNFKSYNQPRLRKLVGHIQNRMSEIKREQFQHATSQKKHLEDINRQLQMYLLAQQQHLERQLSINNISKETSPPKPTPHLADYLFAQRLLEQFENETKPKVSIRPSASKPKREADFEIVESSSVQNAADKKLLEEMAEAGRLEVYGGTDKVSHSSEVSEQMPTMSGDVYGLELTPFKIAYAKLPYLLRSRRYKGATTTTQRQNAT